MTKARTQEYISAVLAALERADPIFGGAATWIAALLLIAALAFVSSEERSRAKSAFWLLGLHVLCVAVLVLLPKRSAASGTVVFMCTVLVLSSMARTTFLIFVHSFLMRRFARPLPKILRDVIQGVIFAIALLLALRSVGVEPGSLLTTSALLTAVVGLSLQDTLGNLFAGLAIQAQRPFTVGDWVSLDEKEADIGRVIEINWRATRVLTLDRVEITIPNGQVAKSSISNFSRPTRVVRRQIEVFAPYEVAPSIMRAALLSGMNHVPEVLSEPPPAVFTKGFTERGVRYIVRYFIDQFHDREIIDSHVHERIWYAMERAKLTISVPRRNVEITEMKAAEAAGDPVESALSLLRRVSLFEVLSLENLKVLAEKCRRERYTSEEVIVHQGDASTEMYVIESGRVRIEVQPEESSRQFVVGQLESGAFFGEMSLVTGERRTANVIAEQDTSVLVLGRDALHPLMKEFPELAKHMSRALAERRKRLNDFPKEDELLKEVDPEHENELLRRIRRLFSSD